MHCSWPTLLAPPLLASGMVAEKAGSRAMQDLGHDFGPGLRCWLSQSPEWEPSPSRVVGTDCAKSCHIEKRVTGAKEGGPAKVEYHNLGCGGKGEKEGHKVFNSFDDFFVKLFHKCVISGRRWKI